MKLFTLFKQFPRQKSVCENSGENSFCSARLLWMNFKVVDKKLVVGLSLN